jgi:hypothetical protein
MSTGMPDPPEVNPKVREEAEVGDRDGLTLRRETLRQERRPKFETEKERRGEHNDGMWGWGGLGGEREQECGVKL